ncbi:30S ribosomal protein S9 [Candidatus Dojkabacteria bacterium]|nr:30S ribosomal protein S9 [Candidatus Dojkabacteria bacterium]
MEAKIQKYNYAVGRRKTSVATIRLFEGKGQSFVNEKKAEERFPLLAQQKRLLKPFEVTGTMGKFYFTGKVKGGGVTGQLDALVHAISRAMIKNDEVYKVDLKKNSLLTRDDRMTERKKPGLRKARKSPQYSKR